jgi:4-amino-4-deoxy-L-arabinose transferase-like glycosyltransferase
MGVGRLLRASQQQVVARQRHGGIGAFLHALPGLLAAMLLGALLILLVYQVPATHAVDIGGYDAAYVQGFHDAQVAAAPTGMPPYLASSDGSARWSRDRSFLLFPQAGLPGHVTLRLRGWRTEGVPPPTVEVWLNGQELLGTVQTSNAWVEYDFPIRGGLLKANDMFLELRSPTTNLAGEERVVGVLLDQATYRVRAGPAGLIWPYPAQVAYGALATGLLWLLVEPRTKHRELRTKHRERRRRWLVLSSWFLVLGLFFLVFYRLQPPFYPYPLRWLLPGVNLLLAALLGLRYGPALIVRVPALLDLLVPAGVLLWLGAVLLVARNHLTLSVPGVENDFRVFATRTDSLAEVFRADGFYNLGYPLLLWLVQPLTADNPFLAARLIAALSGAVLLLAGSWLARSLLARVELLRERHLQRVSGLLALLLLALSPLVVQYALYVGSDMPFAALTALALALLVAAPRPVPDAGRRPAVRVFLAGLVAGGAFLVRHLGLLLLPWGLLASLLLFGRGGSREPPGAHQSRWLTRYALPLAFLLGFLLVALPQLVVNVAQTGQPLYNQQAKNIWLAVYGNIDWGRWDEVPNSIPLTEIVLRDPGRFLGNWWANLRGFVGTGAEDTGEFGRAIQLRLLGWPANWLAVAGVLLWIGQLAVGDWHRGQMRLRAAVATPEVLLLLFVGLYVLAVSMAFILPRFFLPLAPIYAAAAAGLIVWVIGDAGQRTGDAGRTTNAYFKTLVVGFMLLALLWGGFGIGTRYVLEQQPANEVAALQMVQTTLPPDASLLARVPADVPLAKYSAIAHRVVPWPETSNESAALTRAAEQGVAYLLWDENLGAPALPDPDAARVALAGGYGLYRLTVP